MSKLLFDCRQGWEVVNHRVKGWRPQTIRGPVEFTEEAVKAQAREYPADQPAFLDWEHWKLPEEQGKAIQVADWWREERPELRLGFYGILPGMGYYPAVMRGEMLKEWRRNNAALKQTSKSPEGLVDAVDFVLPCLYSFEAKNAAFDHESLWLSHYAKEMIGASRLYQKQVYPFICQRIFIGNTWDQILPDDHFRKQIEYCLKHADGVVVWDWSDNETGTSLLERTSKIMGEFA